MKHATKYLTAAAMLMGFCLAAEARPPNCRCPRGTTRTPGVRRVQPWRLPRDQRERWLDDRFQRYRDDFYGGGGEKTLDRLRDKLRPYRDYWVKWRSKYDDLPRGSRERQVLGDKLRWVRDVLRGGLGVMNEFRTSLSSGSGSTGSSADGSGGDSAGGEGGTTPPAGGTDASTPGAESGGSGSSGDASAPPSGSGDSSSGGGPTPPASGTGSGTPTAGPAGNTGGGATPPAPGTGSGTPTAGSAGSTSGGATPPAPGTGSGTPTAGSGGNTSGGATPPAPGSGSNPPNSNSNSDDYSGAAHTAGDDPLAWILLTMADQEEDKELRDNIDGFVSEAVARHVNRTGGYNASEERIARTVKALREYLRRARGGQSK